MRMSPNWQLIVLACTFLVFVHSDAQLTSTTLAQDSVQAVNKEQQTQGSVKLPARVGLAPYERPACRLPAGQRRFVSQQHQLKQQQQQHSISPTGTGLELATFGTNTTPGTKDGTTNSRRSSEQQQHVQAPGLVSDQTAGTIRRQDFAINSNNRRTQVDSSERLRQLRQLLVSHNYDAYLVGPNDEHGSDYVTEYDRRLRFISGFSGSNGYALILLDRAVLFTDGRYKLQADADLDCNWWLVVGQDPLSDIANWLRAQNASGLRVATDARLMTLNVFDYLDEQFHTKLDLELKLISQDFVDSVWDSHRQTGEPGTLARPRTEHPLQVWPLEFAGQISWQDKVIKLADLMQQYKSRYYVVSKLDDIAWLLNLRGADIPMSPLFKAYLFVSRSPPPSLAEQQASFGPNSRPIASVEQLLNAIEIQKMKQHQLNGGVNKHVTAANNNQQSIKLVLYVDLNKITPSVREHLHLAPGNSSTGVMSSFDGDFSVASNGAKIQVELRDYDVFVADFGDKFAPKSSLGDGQLQGRLLLDAQANVAIHVLAKKHEDRLILVEPLIQRLKAVKNNQEVQGMRQAHWRDSLAIAMLLGDLERDISSGKQHHWTEISASKRLTFLRSLMDHNRGESFDTISAYASNGAIVHYKPNEEDEHRPLSNDSTYLLDSGGQYLDGTTDITRTLHFGTPTDWQRETYTRVLMGSIDMMSLVFPSGLAIGAGNRLNDLLARRHLLELGLDYAHGTGHGIGAYSLVHENPPLIDHYASEIFCPRASKSAALLINDPLELQSNMFTSVEPGYYEPGEFGIRLENIVVTQPFTMDPMNSNGSSATGQRAQDLLRFEPISLVPFEPKLIKLDLLSNKQKAWLNSYNLMVRVRMTQQINYYLARLGQQRDQIAQTTAAGASSLGPSVKLEKMATSNGSVIQAPQGWHKIEPEKLRQLLEQTHKWIMRKTELIQLDVPQRMIGLATSVTQNDRNIKQEATISGGPSKDAWVALGSDPEGQRLMLAYMAQLPFADQEASWEASLLGRADSTTLDSNGGAQNVHKCSGIECDLLLLEALNAHQQQQAAVASVPDSATGAQQQRVHSGLKSTNDELADSVPASTWGKWRQQLIDLFQLNGSASSGANSANWPASILAHMWPILCVGALLVLILQFALMLFACRSFGSASASSSDNSPASLASLGRPRRASKPTGQWQTTASGRRLAQLGDTLASPFRLHSASSDTVQQQGSNQTGTAIV